MINPRKLIGAFLVGTTVFVCSCEKNNVKTLSPDGRTRLQFCLNKSGEMTYSIERDGNAFVLPSSLGFEAEQGNLKDGFVIRDVYKKVVDTTWIQPWGQNKTIRDIHNETVVEMENPQAVKLIFRMRAYNEGVAFRYEWDANGSDSLKISDELTEFNFANDGSSWSIPGDFNTYELKYRKLPLSEVADANTPFTFKVGNTYGSVHEAALYDFPEMCLYKKDSLSFKAELAPLPNGVKAYVPSKFTTAWRTFQIGDKAVDLINSDLILNLNEPAKFDDMSWIKPQKYIGVWWGLHLGSHTWTMGPKHGATTENAVKHIDFAAANNIQGVLFEGWNQGWENWGKSQHFDYMTPYADFDMDYLADYARQKGVDLWMHNETGGNIPEYEVQLDSMMQKYARLGIQTIKTGYAGGIKGGYLHHSQYVVSHYQRVVETAAKNKIMLNVHEPIKDTGIRRTWPNMMTREGARGMEWNAWSEGNTSDYLCTLPFVRLLGGPMDYTPGIFDLDYSRARGNNDFNGWNGDNNSCYIKTTLARQVANWVIIYSPLQMASDLIENYDSHPAFQFFIDYNPDCDWSKAVAGEIGDYIVMVRRSADSFYLGAGTNTEARTILQPLDFLQPEITYEAIIYADTPNSEKNPKNYRIENLRVTSVDTLTLQMASNGGQAISFIPLSN